jgi:hypothetical protein
MNKEFDFAKYKEEFLNSFDDNSLSDEVLFSDLSRVEQLIDMILDPYEDKFKEDWDYLIHYVNKHRNELDLKDILTRMVYLIRLNE